MDHVTFLRHTDAVERSRQLRHPKALQEHFGWSSPYIVMRYLSTFQQEEALRINQEVRMDVGQWSESDCH